MILSYLKCLLSMILVAAFYPFKIIVGISGALELFVLLLTVWSIKELLYLMPFTVFCVLY